MSYRMHSRSLSSYRTLDPGGHQGDYEEDPRKRGVLRNTSCRSYRQKLRNSRQVNIVQSLLIIVGVATVLTILLQRGTGLIPSSTDNKQVEALWSLWLNASNFLGLGQLPEPREKVVREQKQPPARSPYCDQRLDTKRIFHQIGKQVLNQEQALMRMERAVANDRQLRSLALLGPPGVGKTLTAMTLRQHFPWPENVHTYSWSTYVPDEVRKFQLIRQFVEQLTDCGQNLLILDNLSTCDYSIVPIYNRLILEQGDDSVSHNQSVLVLYIFNLETEHYWEQFELLQQLPADTTIVSFRPFGRDELMDCLQHELKMEQRVVEPATLWRILDEALDDVYATGCKRLLDLILKHGVPEID